MTEDERFQSAFARGLTALKAKRFEEARLLFVMAAESTDMLQFPLSWMTAEFNACHALCLQGRKAEAEELAKQIAQKCEAALGNEDPLTSEALAYLAFVLKQHGHPEDAEPVYRRNVEVLEAKYGQLHYLVATAMSKHASLLQTLGRLQEAESIQREALAIMQKIGDMNHPNACLFLTNLAHCLQAAHKIDEATQLMEQAFSIVQSTDDTSLTSAGMVLRKQAEFYRDLNLLDRAEQLGQRALLRLAKRPDINKARFFYYDLVEELYRSILQAKGLKDTEISAQVSKLEAEATKLTASVAK